MEGTIATILLFGGNFAPQSWMYCDGSLLPISQYEALFSLIGTTYGGDGQTTFALPDLRGRIAVGAGTGPGLPAVVLGQAAGAESVSLTTAQMPAHTHMLSATLGVSTANADGSNMPSKSLATAGQNVYAPVAQDSGQGLGGNNITIGNAGNGVPFSVIQPFQAINYVICVEGIYPSRS